MIYEDRSIVGRRPVGRNPPSPSFHPEFTGVENSCHWTFAEPPPRGFACFGFGRFNDSILLAVRGPEQREMSNELGDRTALRAALACGAVGLISARILGGVVGFFAGYVGTIGVLVRGRFIRR